jgi:hypothetical protein
VSHTLYSWRPEEGGESLREQYFPLRGIAEGDLTSAHWQYLIRAYVHSGQELVGGAVPWKLTKPRDSALTVYLLGAASPWPKLDWPHQSWWYRFTYENYQKDRLAAACGVRVEEMSGGNLPEWYVNADCPDWAPAKLDALIASVLHWHRKEMNRIRRLARARFTDPPDLYPAEPGAAADGGGM